MTTKTRRRKARSLPPSTPPAPSTSIVAPSPPQPDEHHEAELVDIHNVRHVVHPTVRRESLPPIRVTMLHQSVAAVDAIEGRKPAPIATTDSTCSSCKHWKADGTMYRNGQEPIGPCRKNAPQRGNVNTFGLADRVWPVTTASDSCGEHTPR